jgi:hypothetical protein
MRIYQVPVCIFCRKQADYLPLSPNGFFWRCLDCSHGKKMLLEEEVLWVECIPLYAKDDD